MGAMIGIILIGTLCLIPIGLIVSLVGEWIDGKDQEWFRNKRVAIKVRLKEKGLKLYSSGYTYSVLQGESQEESYLSSFKFRRLFMKCHKADNFKPLIEACAEKQEKYKDKILKKKSL